MSTLSVTNLKHESASGNNITLASDGTAAFAEIISASKGVKFPATAVASSDPNTLDDYEEGTFTPYFDRLSSSPSISYSGQTGRYVKVGKICHIMAWVNVSSVSSQGGGYWQLKGLPFNSTSSSSRWNGVTALGTFMSANGMYAPDGADYFWMCVIGGSDAFSSNSNASGQMMLCATYETN